MATILGANGRPVKSALRVSAEHAAGRRAQALLARYDAAQTRDENSRHWTAVDHLSADAATSSAVRKTLRARSRYEVANNCYARGLILTLANDLVGTGPRLQMLLDTAAVNARIEEQWEAWALEVDLAGVLRTMRMARVQDGEAFAILTTNRQLEHTVKLDLRLVEADQIATPTVTLDKHAIDGIRFDADGNPVAYHVLKDHPGSASTVVTLGYDSVPAAEVLHWFRADRPGQHRGVPEITPALPLFAQLRRYTLAVLAAAESAAELNVLLKTAIPPGDEAAEIEDTGEDGSGLGGITMDLNRRMATFLPEGWDAFQMRTEQPATVYPDFKRELLGEIARCLNVPVNVAALDSSKHNYASGRLDHQIYLRSIEIDRRSAERTILNRIFAAWMREARTNRFVLPAGAWMEGMDPHVWFWPGLAEVDPRWLNAERDLVLAGLETESEFYARRGRDWEEEHIQRRREQESRQELGLPTLAEMKAAARERGLTVEEVTDAVTDAG